MKAVIISPYFGKLPPWYGLFLLTLERNPELAWLLITDAEFPDPRPANLLVQAMTLPEFNALCQNKLGFDPQITKGYKVCELKPAFGKIFEDLIGGYTHWGYGDCDILLGRVAPFFTEAQMESYDVFSSCRCTITGQFALFPNAGRFREPYQFIPEFAGRVRLEAVQHLDEIITDEALEAQGCRILRRQLQIHDADSAEWRQWAEKREREETGSLDGLFWESGDADWRDGRIVHAATGREAMFFHFHYWKYQWNLPRYPYWPGAISRIAIRKDGLQIHFHKNHPGKRLRFALFHRFPHWVGIQRRRLIEYALRIGRGIARRLPKPFQRV